MIGKIYIAAEPANRAYRLMNEHDYYINALASIERAGSEYEYARQRINEALRVVNEQLHAMKIYL